MQLDGQAMIHVSRGVTIFLNRGFEPPWVIMHTPWRQLDVGDGKGMDDRDAYLQPWIPERGMDKYMNTCGVLQNYGDSGAKCNNCKVVQSKVEHDLFRDLAEEFTNGEITDASLGLILYNFLERNDWAPCHEDAPKFFFKMNMDVEREEIEESFRMVHACNADLQQVEEVFERPDLYTFSSELFGDIVESYHIKNAYECQNCGTIVPKAVHERMNDIKTLREL